MTRVRQELLPANTANLSRKALADECSTWTAPRKGRRPVLFISPLAGVAGAGGSALFFCVYKPRQRCHLDPDTAEVPFEKE